MQKSKGNQKVSSQGQRRSKDPQLPVLPKQPTQKQAQKGTLNQSTQKEKAEFSKILQTGQSLNFSEPLKQDAIHSDTDDTLRSEPPNPTERRLSLDNHVNSNAFIGFGRRNVEELRKTLERDQDFGGLGDELKDPSIVQEENEDDGRRSVFAKTTTSVLIRVRIKGQWFASKVCLFWDRTQQKELYEKELENLKKLRGKSHWHVVLLICHYTKPDGEGCLVLSPLAQCNLAQYLSQTPSVSKKRVVAHSFGCLGSGLAHIHKMHLKHRDIKPENILIHGDNAIIADMGISGLVPDPSQTLSHSSGSRMYMPPELFEDKAHGRRQDVWSLSCCYIVMLAFLKEIPLPEFQKQHKLGCFYYSYDLVVEWLKTVPLASKDDEERALATVLLDSFKKDEDDRPYAQQLVDKIRGIQSSQPYKYIGECCSQVNIPPTAHKSLAPFPRKVEVHEKGSLIDFLVNAGCHILRTTKSLEVQESLWELHERAKRQEITSIRSAERKLLMIIAPKRCKTAKEYLTFANAFVGRLMEAYDSGDYMSCLYNPEIGEDERPFTEEYFAILIDEISNRCRTSQWISIPPSRP